MRAGAPTGETLHQYARVSWYAMAGGALALTGVAAIFGPGIWSRARGNFPPLAWSVFAMALMALLASRVLPDRMVRSGPTFESIAYARIVVVWPSARPPRCLQ
jgi:hypothetical protein